jgi:hypothetical protein
MRLRKFLIVVGIVMVAALGWLYWKKTQPAPRYVFEFEARVEGEIVSIRSVVGCYRSDAGYGASLRTVTLHAIKEHAFATKLKSGLTFYVAVPDMCAYAQTWDGAYVSPSDRERPSMTTPQSVVPLTYMSDGREEPDIVWLFTSPNDSSSTTGPAILQSTVRQFDAEADRDLAERTSDRPDPFAPSGGTTHGWLGVVFLPVPDAPELQPTWIEDRWQAGGCEIVRLNEQGRGAISSLNPYDAHFERLWMRLWNNTALSGAYPTGDDELIARHALGAVIPATPIREGFEIRPDRFGTVALFRADSARRTASLRASNYFFNGIPLSKDSSEATLPFVIRCTAQNALYAPTTLNYIRMSPH